MSSNSSENVTAEGQALLSAPRRLEFVSFDPPAIGQAVAIAPGVRWCRIPLPIDLDHINVWLLDYEDGCVAVDTGMAVPAAEEAWQALEADALRERPLRGVFVTHLHPDHFGLARWLQQRFSVPVWMSARTLAQIRTFLATDPAEVTVAAQAFFREHGLADQTLPPGVSPARFARMMSGVPHIESSIEDGETIGFGAERWTALETNGHAEGHMCLHNAAAQILISGDQVLPTISSNIGLTWRSGDPNPLGSYLASLDRLYMLPRETLVLPSHGLPFRGLKERIEDLRAHHLQQLEAVELACDEPKTALEVLPAMFRRSLHGMHFFLAMAEALAHLEYLVHAGRLRKERDGEGVTRFARLAVD
jgi:glyoxylase-like metal-dependent hydrolase (beta-lactamase superfamily II)